jgi:hypothetical protein
VNPIVVDLIKLLLAGLVGSLLTFIIMLIRERNNFATKVMDLFLEDKKNWTTERKQLEDRIDYLMTELDKVKLELYTRGGSPG